MKKNASISKVTEAQLHASVAGYLNAILAPEVFWTTFPAGGGGRFRGAMLKRAGLRPGVPDILIIHGGFTYGIELKTATGALSLEQKGCHMDLAIAGANVSVCRSLDDVAYFLKTWGIPTRARAA